MGHDIAGLAEEVVRAVERDFDAWSLAGRVLAATSDKWARVRRRGTVPVDRILACRWNEARAESIASAGVEAVLRKHPPYLAAYETVDGGMVYYPVDGNHRVIAAREAGLREIPAIITALHRLPESRILHLIGPGLWRERDTVGGRVLELVLRLRDAELSMIDLVAKVLALRGVTLIRHRSG